MSDLRRSVPEITLAILVVVTILAVHRVLPFTEKGTAQRLLHGAAPTRVTLQLLIKVEDLGSDLSQLERDDMVTLVVLLGREAGTTSEIVEYPNLRVSDITFSNGEPVAIVLSVSAVNRDAILTALRDKQALYLQPEETNVGKPADDVTPESAATSGIATSTPSRFILPVRVSDLASDAFKVIRGEYVTLIVLKSDTEDAASMATPHAYPNLSVVSVLDANGLDTESTRRRPHTIRLYIEEANRDKILSALADTNKRAVYLLPQGNTVVAPTTVPEPPTATPTAITFDDAQSN